MKSPGRRTSLFTALTLAVTTFAGGMGTAMADPDGRGNQEWRGGHADNRQRGDHHSHGGDGDDGGTRHFPVPWGSRPRDDDRFRHYHDVIVVRPFGRHYYGYGDYHSDSSAFQWLAFTAITLAILDNMNEAQQRAHEQAQIQATTAPIGEQIHWNNGDAVGSVTAIREGVSTSGRYCREFQQNVTIGGESQQAYGTACRQPDGTWEVVSTGNTP